MAAGLELLNIKHGRFEERAGASTPRRGFPCTGRGRGTSCGRWWPTLLQGPWGIPILKWVWEAPRHPGRWDREPLTLREGHLQLTAPPPALVGLTGAWGAEAEARPHAGWAWGPHDRHLPVNL